MVTAINWKAARILALTLISTVSYSAGIFLSYGGDCGTWKELEGYDLPAEDLLHTLKVPLSTLPLNLGVKLPNLRELYFYSLPAPSPDAVPTAEQERLIVPCTKVTKLRMAGLSFGSPRSIGWLRFFFPNLTVLDMLGALPIQTEEAAKLCKDENLRLESVTELTLPVFPRDCKLAPPLIENLELFPNLKRLLFYHIDPTLTNSRESGMSLLRLPRAEYMEFSKMHPRGREVLSKLPLACSNLEFMQVDANIFEELTSGNAESENMPIPQFKCLAEICVRCKYADLHIGAKLAEVFPKLRRLEIRSPSEIYLPDSSVQLRSMRSVEIYSSNMEIPPSFSDFERIFPGLDPSIFVSTVSPPEKSPLCPKA